MNKNLYLRRLSIILNVVCLASLTEAQTVKPKKSPPQSKPSLPSKAPAQPAPVLSILDQALKEARATVEQIVNVEFPKYRAPNPPSNIERMMVLEVARKNAQWVIDHEEQLRTVYTSFLKGTPALPNTAQRNQEWLSVQKTTTLSPRDVCKPAESGCFVDLNLETVVLYFEALQEYKRQFKGNLDLLEQGLSSPYATVYGLTPEQGMAALEVWNLIVESSNPHQYPSLSWDPKNHIFTTDWNNTIDVLVLAENALIESDTQVKADRKILLDDQIDLASLGEISNQDQLIWGLIQYANVKIDQMPISGDDRLRQYLKLENQLVLCPDSVKTVGPLSNFNFEKSKILSETDSKNSTYFLSQTPRSNMTNLESKLRSNKHRMSFVRIKAGTFTMGSGQPEVTRVDRMPKSTSKQEARENETAHVVSLTRDFLMQTTEVSQQQYASVMGIDVNNVTAIYKGLNLPMTNLTWVQVQAFINRLNQIENPGLNCGDVGTASGFEQARKTKNCYRLPTEAEWEYAARAGTTSIHAFGENAADIGNYAWHSGNSNQQVQEVTACPSNIDCKNIWGLYHMHGNVWEMVQDHWDGSSAYGIAAKVDPCIDTGAKIVIRGCSINQNVTLLRSAYRGIYDKEKKLFIIGFRLVRTL